MGYTLLGYSVDVAIQSFASLSIEAFFLEEKVPRRAGWSGISRVVMRKLDLLDYAEALSDLASPPGNRLEALRGDLVGLHSIRANDQWRVVFRWTDQGPEEVDICDYH
jgi:proteic killer suppression protein